MTALLLIFKGLRFKPLRSVLLLSGFSVGVMVMTVLLSVGTAILDQAREEDLVGGGDVVVLPAGIDVSVMKTGGVTGMFFRIPNGRFLTRSFLASAEGVATVSPEISGAYGTLTYDGEDFPIDVTGVIPSRHQRLHNATASGFTDSPADVDYTSPPYEDRTAEMDRFHEPRYRAGDTWAEWHYFNFVDSTTGQYGYVSLSAIADENGTPYSRGNILVEYARPGRRKIKVQHEVPRSVIRVSRDTPDVRIGDGQVVFNGESYVVTVTVPSAHGRIDLSLTLHPDRNRQLPPLLALDEARSIGYTVPVVRGRASGSITIGGEQHEITGVGYHDHNWGFFRNAVWDWGIVRAGDWDILYGRFTQSPERLTSEPLFVAVFDANGPYLLNTTGECTVAWDGKTPRTVTLGFATARDTIAIRLDVTGHYASSFGPEGGDAPDSAAGPRFTFYQMEATADVQASLLGSAHRLTGHAFAETFRTR